MSPRSSNDVNYLESQERYSHQSRSETRYQSDPDKKELYQSDKFFKFCEKTDHSISGSFKRQSNKIRQAISESRLENCGEPKFGTRKILGNFLQKKRFTK